MTEQLLTQTFRLHPTKDQEEYFWRATRVDNAVYNKSKEWDDSIKGDTGSFATQRELLDLLKMEKSENPFFQGIEYHTLREGVFRYLEARQRAFNKVSKWPRFSSLKHRRKRSFHVREDNMRIHLDGKVTIPGMSKIDRKGVSYTEVNVYDIEAKPRKARVVFDGKYWLLRYVITVEIEPEPAYSSPIGVDLGLKEFAVTSDGTSYDRINKSQKYQHITKTVKGLQRKLQRQRDAHIKGEPVSRNYLRAKFRLRAVERHLEEFKKTYRQGVARDILKDNPSTVVLEDLSITGMIKNKSLSSHIQEVGWYTFRLEVEWQQRKKMGEVVLAPTNFPSSKMCSGCGTVKNYLSLGDRTYICDKCSLVLDRDLNAAINLRNLAGSVNRLNSSGVLNVQAFNATKE